MNLKLKINSLNLKSKCLNQKKNLNLNLESQKSQKKSLKKNQINLMLKKFQDLCLSHQNKNQHLSNRHHLQKTMKIRSYQSLKNKIKLLILSLMSNQTNHHLLLKYPRHQHNLRSLHQSNLQNQILNKKSLLIKKNDLNLNQKQKMKVLLSHKRLKRQKRKILMRKVGVANR